VNGQQFTEEEFHKFVDPTTGEVTIPFGYKPMSTRKSSKTVIDSLIENEESASKQPDSTPHHYGQGKKAHTVWLNKAGQYHRLDGPAIEYDNHDTKYWYVNGQQLSKEEFYTLVDPLTGNTIKPLGRVFRYRHNVDDPEEADD
jgi:hypothetical protein